MLKLFKYLTKRDVLFVIFCVLFVVAQVWIELKLPDYMTSVTKTLMSDGLSKDQRLSDIWKNGGMMMGCALLSLVCSIVIGFFAAKISASFAQRLRKGVFEKVQNFSMEEINQFSTSSLITRSTNDITQVQMVVVMGLQVLIKAPVMAVWAIIKIWNKNITWTLETAIFVGVMIFVILLLMIFVIPKFKKIQTLTDDLNRVTRENLNGIRVVRAYNAEEYQEKKFDDTNKTLTKYNLFANRALVLMDPLMTLIMCGISLAIYWTGAYMINGAQTIASKIDLFSDMSVFSTYSISVIMSFMMLIMMFILLPRAIISGRRISEVLDTQTKIKDGNGATSNISGTVEFINVSFKYPDAEEYVIEGINFVANKGETVAFIGSTGSGKSTLINLIPRFYDVTEGEILVDGNDIRKYTQEQLHEKLGYISQKAVLFKGTINSNIVFGDVDASHEEVENAAKIAQASEFIDKIENNYNHEIAQGGTNVSGGQKQRISIARAIAKNPEIFIFDDSFSALDYKTDKLLRKALDESMNDKTKLIVAQRIGTIMDADKIIVLDNGKIVGMGKHQELLESCDVYKQIAESQLSKEELGYE